MQYLLRTVGVSIKVSAIVRLVLPVVALLYVPFLAFVVAAEHRVQDLDKDPSLMCVHNNKVHAHRQTLPAPQVRGVIVDILVSMEN